jgi:hypothetical protein
MNVRGGGATARDDVGLDVPCLAAARDSALALLRNAPQARSASQFPIEAVVITGEDGQELATVHAAEPAEHDNK